MHEKVNTFFVLFALFSFCLSVSSVDGVGARQREGLFVFFTVRIQSHKAIKIYKNFTDFFCAHTF